MIKIFYREAAGLRSSIGSRHLVFDNTDLALVLRRGRRRMGIKELVKLLVELGIDCLPEENFAAGKARKLVDRWNTMEGKHWISSVQQLWVGGQTVESISWSDREAERERGAITGIGVRFNLGWVGWIRQEWL